MKHKKQHYIPASYLRAWCDPKCPPGHTPFTWVFSKDGSEFKRKSPERLFNETDMYTVYAADGVRDLSLEMNLSRLESAFHRLRHHKISKKQPLTVNDQLLLCMFTMAMYGRTKAYGNYWSNQWKKALEIGEKMQQRMDEALVSGQPYVPVVPTSNTEPEYSYTLEEVKQFVAQPIQSSLPDLVAELSPVLMQIPFVILETSLELGFLTSDAPCVWHDPALSSFPEKHIRVAGGLASPTIEITLPLSPTQLLYIGKKLSLSNLYVHLDDELLIDELNWRTRTRAQETFVVNQPAVRRKWF